MLIHAPADVATVGALERVKHGGDALDVVIAGHTHTHIERERERKRERKRERERGRGVSVG